MTRDAQLRRAVVAALKAGRERVNSSDGFVFGHLPSDRGRVYDGAAKFLWIARKENGYWDSVAKRLRAYDLAIEMAEKDVEK